MLASILVAVGFFFALLVIDHMCSDNEDNAGNQEPDLRLVVGLFDEHQYDPGYKEQHGQQLVVVSAEPMREGIDTYSQRQHDHTDLKSGIVDDVHAQDRKTAHQYGEQRTMDRTGDGCSDPKGIKIDLQHRRTANLSILQQSCNCIAVQNHLPCLILHYSCVMRKKALIYFIFFVVLLGGFYAALITWTDFEKVKLPVLNTVQPFSFLRQDSTSVTNKEIRGRVYVAEYFFTTCRGICPKMNRNMGVVYERFKSNPNFLILSHTVDPKHDSIPVLRKYADSLGAKVDNWWFVTGTKEALYKAARESYILDDPQNSSKNITEQFLHTQFFALVDKQGRVRGIYDGIKKDEVDQLMLDIEELIKE